PPLRGRPAAHPRRNGRAGVPPDRGRRHRSRHVEPEPVLRLRRRRGLCAAARHDDRRRHRRPRGHELRAALAARAGAAPRMLHGSRVPPIASASVAPSTGRPYGFVSHAYLNSTPLANSKFSAIANAMNAKSGVHTPATSAAPETSWPSGTSRAKYDAYGSAIAARYRALHDVAGT